MLEIPANSLTFRVDIERTSWMRGLVAKSYLFLHPIADRLHPWPSRSVLPNSCHAISEPVNLAIAACQQETQSVMRQPVHRNLRSVPPPLHPDGRNPQSALSRRSAANPAGREFACIYCRMCQSIHPAERAARSESHPVPEDPTRAKDEHSERQSLPSVVKSQVRCRSQAESA